MRSNRIRGISFQKEPSRWLFFNVYNSFQSSIKEFFGIFVEFDLKHQNPHYMWVSMSSIKIEVVYKFILFFMYSTMPSTFSRLHFAKQQNGFLYCYSILLSLSVIFSNITSNNFLFSSVVCFLYRLYACFEHSIMFLPLSINCSFVCFIEFS